MPSKRDPSEIFFIKDYFRLTFVNVYYWQKKKTKDTEALTLKDRCLIRFNIDNAHECFALCEPVLKKQRPSILFLKSIYYENFIRGVVKLAKNEEESMQLIKIQAMLGDLGEHIVRVLQVKGRMFLMSYPRPFQVFPPIKTLKDLFVPRVCRKFCSENLLKSIIFQVLCCLERLHSHNVEFTHNDMKAENILLSRCEMPLLSFPDCRIYSKGVCAVFIDAESVTGLVFPCTLGKALSQKEKREFGMFEKWSEFTDIHLVFMEILFACRTTSPSWGTRFAEFLETDGIPLKYFKAPYITCQNRLSLLGKDALQKEHCSLRKMIQSQYFSEIRVKEFL